MPEGVFASVCKTGYANLATTDSGFFGKGIYNTHEAAYAYRCYATLNGLRAGVLLMNWVSSYSVYPVIKGDMGKLTGKGNYQNYDAHLIPVQPRNRNNPREMSYLPCGPTDVPTYHEMVVFEQASCLPRYRVTLRKSGPMGAMAPTVVVPGQAAYVQGEALFQQSQYRAALPHLLTAAVSDYPPAYLLLYILYNNSGLVGPKEAVKARNTKRRRRLRLRGSAKQRVRGKQRRKPIWPDVMKMVLA